MTFFNPQKVLPKSITPGDIPPVKSMTGGYLSIALPSVVEMMLVTLINMIDTMMVSTIGTDAVAAVGIVTQPRMLMLCFFFAMNTGITAVVARRKGEDRQETANQVVRNAIELNVFLSAILMSIMIPIARPLMIFAGAEVGRTVEDAVVYFRILTYALPFQGLSLGMCAAQRGVGRTKLTMTVNVTSNLVNILFNWLLINGIGPFPKLGVKGAAIATAIGLFCGFCLCLGVYIRGNRRGEFLHLSIKDNWRLDGKCVKDVTRIASSSMVEQLALRFGFFMYAKIVASLGTDAFAAHQIACQYFNISFSCADGLGIAGTSLVGQKLGERRKDLAFLYGSLAQRVALMASFVIAAICIVLRRPLVGLYISENATEGVSGLAQSLLLFVALLQPFQMVSAVVSGNLRGAGDVRYTARVMAICVAGIRTIIPFVSVSILGRMGYTEFAIYGAWSGCLVDMIIRVILFKRRYNSARWCDIHV